MNKKLQIPPNPTCAYCGRLTEYDGPGTDTQWIEIYVCHPCEKAWFASDGDPTDYERTRYRFPAKCDDCGKRHG